MKPAYYGWILALLLAIAIGVQSCFHGKADAKAIAAADSADVRAKEAARTVDRLDSLLALHGRDDSALAAKAALGLAAQHEATRLRGVVAALQGTISTPLPAAPDTCKPWAARVATLGIINDSLRVLDAADTTRARAAEDRAALADSSRTAALWALGMARDTLAAARNQLRRWPTPPTSKSWGVLADARLTPQDANAFAGVTWKALALGAQGRVDAAGWHVQPEARVTFALRVF